MNLNNSGVQKLKNKFQIKMVDKNLNESAHGSEDIVILSNQNQQLEEDSQNFKAQSIEWSLAHADNFSKEIREK